MHFYLIIKEMTCDFPSGIFWRVDGNDRGHSLPPFFLKKKIQYRFCRGWGIVVSLVVISVQDGNSVERSNLEAIADHKFSNHCLNNASRERQQTFLWNVFGIFVYSRRHKDARTWRTAHDREKQLFVPGMRRCALKCEPFLFCCDTCCWGSCVIFLLFQEWHK